MAHHMSSWLVVVVLGVIALFAAEVDGRNRCEARNDSANISEADRSAVREHHGGRIFESTARGQQQQQRSQANKQKMGGKGDDKPRVVIENAGRSLFSTTDFRDTLPQSDQRRILIFRAYVDDWINVDQINYGRFGFTLGFPGLMDSDTFDDFVVVTAPNRLNGFMNLKEKFLARPQVLSTQLGNTKGDSYLQIAFSSVQDYYLTTAEVLNVTILPSSFTKDILELDPTLVNRTTFFITIEPDRPTEQQELVAAAALAGSAANLLVNSPAAVAGLYPFTICSQMASTKLTSTAFFLETGTPSASSLLPTTGFVFTIIFVGCVALLWGSLRGLNTADVFALIRFPSCAICLANYFYPAMCIGFVQTLSAGNTVTSGTKVIVAVPTAVVILLRLAWTHHSLYHYVVKLKRIRFVSYPMTFAENIAKIPRVLIPAGAWGPTRFFRQYHHLFAQMGRPQWPIAFLAIQDYVLTLTLLLAGIQPTTRVGCTAVFLCQFAIHFALASFVHFQHIYYIGLINKGYAILHCGTSVFFLFAAIMPRNILTWWYLVAHSAITVCMHLMFQVYTLIEESKWRPFLWNVTADSTPMLSRKRAASLVTERGSFASLEEPFLEQLDENDVEEMWPPRRPSTAGSSSAAGGSRFDIERAARKYHDELPAEDTRIIASDIAQEVESVDVLSHEVDEHNDGFGNDVDDGGVEMEAFLNENPVADDAGKASSGLMVSTVPVPDLPGSRSIRSATFSVPHFSRFTFSDALEMTPLAIEDVKTHTTIRFSSGGGCTAQWQHFVSTDAEIQAELEACQRSRRDAHPDSEEAVVTRMVFSCPVTAPVPLAAVKCAYSAMSALSAWLTASYDAQFSLASHTRQLERLGLAGDEMLEVLAHSEKQLNHPRMKAPGAVEQSVAIWYHVAEGLLRDRVKYLASVRSVVDVFLTEEEEAAALNSSSDQATNAASSSVSVVADYVESELNRGSRVVFSRVVVENDKGTEATIRVCRQEGMLDAQTSRRSHGRQLQQPEMSPFDTPSLTLAMTPFPISHAEEVAREVLFTGADEIALRMSATELRVQIKGKAKLLFASLPWELNVADDYHDEDRALGISGRRQPTATEFDAYVKQLSLRCKAVAEDGGHFFTGVANEGRDGAEDVKADIVALVDQLSLVSRVLTMRLLHKAMAVDHYRSLVYGDMFGVLVALHDEIMTTAQIGSKNEAELIFTTQRRLVRRSRLNGRSVCSATDGTDDADRLLTEDVMREAIVRFLETGRRTGGTLNSGGPTFVMSQCEKREPIPPARASAISHLFVDPATFDQHIAAVSAYSNIGELSAVTSVWRRKTICGLFPRLVDDDTLFSACRFTTKLKTT